MTSITQLGIEGFGLGSLVETGENALPASQQYASKYQQTLQFPSDLFDNKDFYMSFRFVEYQKRTIGESKPVLKDVGTIRIPLPRGLRDQSSVHYNTTNLNAAIGAGAETLATGIANGTISTSAITSLGDKIKSAYTSGASGQKFGDTINAATSGISPTGSSLGSVASAAITGDAASGIGSTPIGQAISAYSGLAVNPFMTVIFDSPTFKQHSFEWLFTPKNAAETESLRSIIQTFKYHMLPGIGPNTKNILFNYPSMVMITISPDAYMYQFKPAVIRGLTIDYAPNDTPAFFKNNNAPVAVRVIMDLQEIEIWTKNDFLTQQTTTSSPSSSSSQTPALAAGINGMAAGPV